MAAVSSPLFRDYSSWELLNQRLFRWRTHPCLCLPQAKNIASARIFRVFTWRRAVLNLSGLGLCCLPRRAFKLLSCSRIDVHGNKISRIFKSVFGGSCAIEIDLSYNLIHAIECEAFRRCPEIRRLQLSANALKGKLFLCCLPRPLNGVRVELIDNFSIIELFHYPSAILNDTNPWWWTKEILPWIALCNLTHTPPEWGGASRVINERGYLTQQACSLYASHLLRFAKKSHQINQQSAPQLLQIRENLIFSALLQKLQDFGPYEQNIQAKLQLYKQIKNLPQGGSLIVQGIITTHWGNHAISYKIVRNTSLFQLFIYDTAGLSLHHTSGGASYTFPFVFSGVTLSEITSDACLDRIMNRSVNAAARREIQDGIIHDFRLQFGVAEQIETSLAAQFSKQVMGTCTISSLLAVLQASLPGDLFFHFKTFLLQEARRDCLRLMHSPLLEGEDRVTQDILMPLCKLLQQQRHKEETSTYLRPRTAWQQMDVLNCIYEYYMREHRECKEKGCENIATQFAWLARDASIARDELLRAQISDMPERAK